VAVILGERVNAKTFSKLKMVLLCVFSFLFILVLSACSAHKDSKGFQPGTSWESVTIDCQSNQTDPLKPNYAVDPPNAGIDLNGYLFWKEKTGLEFTIQNIKDNGTKKASTPFRTPSGIKKFTVQSSKGRTEGDRAQQEGVFKYDVYCANGKIFDPMIHVPIVRTDAESP
jgi:hypothetical protein